MHEKVKKIADRRHRQAACGLLLLAIGAAGCLAEHAPSGTAAPASSPAAPPPPWHFDPAPALAALALTTLESGAVRPQCPLSASGEAAVPCTWRTVMSQLMAREGELAGWVAPLLFAYLPPGTVVPKVVVLVIGEATAYKPGEDRLQLALTAPAGRGSADLIWTEMVGGLYRAGLTNAGISPPPTREPKTSAELIHQLLAKISREGMVRYVSGHGRAYLEGGEDLLELQRREDASPRFMAVREATRSLRFGHPVREVWHQLLLEDRSQQVFAYTGAYMARRLEDLLGRAALVDQVRHGGQEFYTAYQATGPGALVSFLLPVAAEPESKRRQVPVTH